MKKYLFVFLSFFVIGGVATADSVCGAGNYYDSVSCRPCPKGTYNPNPQATSCTKCPAGFTTVTTGSTEAKSCIRYVDKLKVGNSAFSWPDAITPSGKVDTTYLSFPSS